jgi:hypothetical protein
VCSLILCCLTLLSYCNICVCCWEKFGINWAGLTVDRAGLTACSACLGVTQCVMKDKLCSRSSRKIIVCSGATEIKICRAKSSASDVVCQEEKLVLFNAKVRALEGIEWEIACSSYYVKLTDFVI